MTLRMGDILNSRYRIEGTLGQGGFGAVYRARDINLDRECAVKENLDLSSRAHRQFEREARILANLSHANLPRVIDHFVIQGQGQYLVMDLVVGLDLEQMVESKQKPVPEAQAIGWILEAAEALDYLHHQHPPIIHRDIKPANIIVSTDGKVFLVDFGLAKIFDPQLKTTLGARGVSPGYSPQEQYGRGRTDVRSDIYALGASLYFILTGEEPPESIQRNLGAVLTPLRAFNSSISPSVERAVLKAMEMKPDQRFGSVREFRMALSGNFPTPGRIIPRSHVAVPAAKAKTGLKASHGAGTIYQRPWAVVLFMAVIVSIVFLLVVMRMRFAHLNASPETSPKMPSALAAPATIRPVTTENIPNLTPETAEELPMVYMVKAGDTCSGIAVQFGIDMESIWQLNNLFGGCEKLLAGQQILLPRPSKEAVQNNPSLAEEMVTAGATKTAARDGMELVYIPEGVFWRGSDAEEPNVQSDEQPKKAIYLDAFWIDQTEVTNGKYEQCVFAGVCSPPAQTSSKRNFVYFGKEGFEDYPVIYVSWDDASDYCRWVGRRLPTEAEWEKAARGTDGRYYPWGNSPPTGKLANYNNQVGDTTPVGSYLGGKSPYGVLDLAGNVAEWVADWFDENFYSISPVFNPPGPEMGEFRILRGGSWINLSHAIRAAQRLWNFPDSNFEGGGFRCAVSESEE